MLTDGGFVKVSGTGVLTRAGKALKDVWSGRISNRLWNVLSESNNTFQSQLPILPLYTSVKAFPTLVKTPVPNNLPNPPSVNIFLTTLNVPYSTIRTKSLSSLKLAPHFISLPWKRLSSNL